MKDPKIYVMKVEISIIQRKKFQKYFQQKKNYSFRLFSQSNKDYQLSHKNEQSLLIRLLYFYVKALLPKSKQILLIHIKKMCSNIFKILFYPIIAKPNGNVMILAVYVSLYLRMFRLSS